jgi:hypothetical protein
MASKDLKNNIDVQPTLIPQTIGITTTAGTAVAVAGYDSVTLVLSSGSAGVGTVTLQECATSGGTYTDVAAADCIGTNGLALVQDESVTLGYIGTLGFVKVSLVTTTGDEFSSNVILSHPRVAKTGAN